MKSEFINFLNKSISLSFYALFFLVPLLIHPATSELFEFNKMWFVFGMSAFIFFLWGAKAILLGKIQIRRTPLDIPIFLFLLSQIISTIFSLDSSVSFWGYYGRFNGGLLSTISYIFLYYAFATNMISLGENKRPTSFKILFTVLLSGIVVALWGLPSHFGYDPTCLLFRGTFDVACWTEQFQPKVRIFSTLGQPNWLATYLGFLIPLSIAFGIVSIRQRMKKAANLMQKSFLSQVFSWKSLFYFLTIILFYVDLIYARSQSAFIGVFVGMQIFFGLLFAFTTGLHKFNLKNILKDTYFKYVFIVNIFFLLITFFEGTPIGIVNKYVTWGGINTIIEQYNSPKLTKTTQAPPTKEEQPAGPALEAGGSESGKIRLYVWEGALQIFARNPIIGTGVETFAFAYYKVKPTGHNLTSEWDYLYNKAHNEYLNYLATTGIFGLGTYLLFILTFLIRVLKDLTKRKTHDMSHFPISIAIVSGFVTIIISNFFGFSVVIVNLLFFFIPLWFYEMEFPSSLTRFNTFKFSKESSDPKINETISGGKWLSLFGIGVIVLFWEFLLLTYWFADQKYALGQNLDRVGDYSSAFEPLKEATRLRPNEDLFKDEYSVNLATLAVLLAQQKQTGQAEQLVQQSILLSNEVIKNHPNNIVYWKSRARVFYALSQLNPQYLDLALEAIIKASELAPTDAKISYNLALFYNQKNDSEAAIKYLEKAIELKPNYLDPMYAIAVIYDELRKQNAGKDPALALKYKTLALDKLSYILTKLDPTHTASKELYEKLNK